MICVALTGTLVVRLYDSKPYACLTGHCKDPIRSFKADPDQMLLQARWRGLTARAMAGVFMRRRRARLLKLEQACTAQPQRWLSSRTTAALRALKDARQVPQVNYLCRVCPSRPEEGQDGAGQCNDVCIRILHNMERLWQGSCAYKSLWLVHAVVALQGSLRLRVTLCNWHQ